MKFFYAIFITMLALLFTQCEMKETPQKSEKSVVKSNMSLDNATAFQQRMADIDGKLNEYQIANSLFYTADDQSTIEVYAYLDEAENIVKLKEFFFDAATNERGTKEYFLTQGKRFATRELFMESQDKGGKYLERISYYNESEQVLYTKERKALYEEDLEREMFAEVAPQNCSGERARMVMNQEGPFATNFQGFLSEGPMSYLIVGGSGDDAYASALAVQFVDDQLARLKNNPSAFIDNPLLVQFEKLRDDRNFEYQVLLMVKIL
eukprot:TRINITY_DN63579_c1_g1_i1.p1 TRINITY_DN63579_c1_g1~~TRINITY_DN63579_c1_g1_i1.p1  ORF type:complete len:273 (-),score=-9.84 TRINITY_DN63579_c1_g1_i1:381-1175(-)